MDKLETVAGDSRAYIEVIASPADDPIAILQQEVIKAWLAEQLATPTVMAGLNANFFEKKKLHLEAIETARREAIDAPEVVAASKALDNQRRKVVQSLNRRKSAARPSTAKPRPKPKRKAGKRR